MNYKKIYNDFMLNRKLHPQYTSYYEEHHILPRAMGGNDDVTNLVKLTAREHCLAHMILAKACRGSQYEATTAVMLLYFKRNMTSRMYGYVREQWSKAARNRSPAEKKQILERRLQTNANKSQQEKDLIFKHASKAQLKVWSSMTDEQRKQRAKNISEGTKKAMAKIDQQEWKESRQRAGKTLSDKCKARTVERREELAVNYARYHVGSKAMSNPLTHHWRYVSEDQQDSYLKNGYVFGNLSKEWIAQGYVKVAKGRYALQ